MKLAKFAGAILDLIYPRYCLICSVTLNHTDRKALCSDCQDKIEFVSQKTACPKCGLELGPYVESYIRCRDCAVNPPRFKQAFAVARYTGIMRDLIHLFKFNRQKVLLDELSALLINKWAQARPELPPIDLIIPTPLHSKKLRQRRFNQCELLARELSKATATPAELNNLIKIKETADQSSLNATERKQNIIDAFIVRNPQSVEDKNILLIDDVLTTGSTASEITRMLKNNGAKNVYVLVLGR